jgi:hypothetical protein
MVPAANTRAPLGAVYSVTFATERRPYTETTGETAKISNPGGVGTVGKTRSYS